jgi:hypothetical protein
MVKIALPLSIRSIFLPWVFDMKTRWVLKHYLSIRGQVLIDLSIPASYHEDNKIADKVEDISD